MPPGSEDGHERGLGRDGKTEEEVTAATWEDMNTPVAASDEWEAVLGACNSPITVSLVSEIEGRKDRQYIAASGGKSRVQ